MSDLSRRSVLAGAAGLPLLAVAAQAQMYDDTGDAGTAAQPAADQVVIQGMAFNPATLTIAAGTTVTFTNQDSVPHTVTADSGAFDTGNLAPGASVRMTFPGASTYAYHCNIHPSMRGTITVV